MDVKTYDRIETYRNTINLAIEALDRLIEVSPEEALGEIMLTEINLRAARNRAKEAKKK